MKYRQQVAAEVVLYAHLTLSVDLTLKFLALKGQDHSGRKQFGRCECFLRDK